MLLQGSDHSYLASCKTGLSVQQHRAVTAMLCLDHADHICDRLKAIPSKYLCDLSLL